MKRQLQQISLVFWLFLWVSGRPALASAHLQAQLLQLADARHFAAETLAAAAEDANPEIRRACARLLGHFRQDAAVRLALSLAADSVPAVREEALASLGRMLPWLSHKGLQGRVRKALLQGLADPQASVRRAAAWAWAAAGDPEAGLLAALSREQEPTVKVAILQELWRLPGPAWRGVAAKYLAASQGELRRAALWSLARAEGEEVLPALAQALRDPDPQVRQLACEGVRRYKPVQLAAHLVPLVSDPEESVQVAALNALAELGAAAKEVLRSQELRKLSTLLAQEDLQHPHLRVAAIRLAGAVGCCQEALGQLLEEGGWFGGEALLALARQGNRQVVEQELASGEVQWRRWAVLALAFLPQGEELLAKALTDPAPSVRLAAAEVAGKLSSPRSRALLESLLADSDSAVRAQACESLALRGEGPPPATLVRLLRQELASPGGDAAVSLVRLLGKPDQLAEEAAGELEQLRYHPDPAVARAAWEELFRHGRVRPYPSGKLQKPLSFYQEVVRFAAKPRFLEVVTWRGTFLVALDTQLAPLASYTLSELAEKKFFDELTFHRVVSNFVVQGGDPRGDGWGGPGFFVRDELSLAPFPPGTVGLALAGPDTGGSQFFVTLAPTPHLLGRYPVVGRVVAGMDVVARLQVGDKILRVRPGEGTPPTPIPVWYGLLSRERLEAEIPDFAANRKEYKPQALWLQYLRQARSSYGLVVAMGTWCSDSREQIPHLWKILDELGTASPFAEVKLLGVDRSKKVVPSASFPYGPVEKVPTIVVTLGGSEVGRIVETPLAGSLEEDLVRILAPFEGWNLPEEN